MSQFFQIHPENPQARLIRQAATIIQQGGVIVYPTDSGYALGCHLGDKQALERIRRIRQLDEKHNFTLVCRDLSELAVYAKVDNMLIERCEAIHQALIPLFCWQRMRCRVGLSIQSAKPLGYESPITSLLKTF